MSFPLYQVDAFADAPFEGNPAAVCFPDRALSDDTLLAIAAEMNLSETAFVWPGRSGWRLRWFTPAVEVDLCGHATLATAHVLWETGRAGGPLLFETRSGELGATHADELIQLDFPATPPSPAEVPPGLLAALGVEGMSVETLRSRFDYLVVLADDDRVRALEPSFRALQRLDVRGVMVSAPAKGAHDFVSRFFAPGAGIDEDPVTGSAHCTLGPYWAGRLGRSALVGRQVSARGGTVRVEVHGDRVRLGGSAVTVFEGTLRI